MNKLEQNRKIIANAPEGARIVESLKSGKRYYLREDKHGIGVDFYYKGAWYLNGTTSSINVRSLADIRENIALQEEVLKYQKRVAELESSVELLQKQTETMLYQQKSNNLEQQAKGLQDYAHEELSGLSADNIHWMLTRAKGLRQQAKALEEE